MKHLAWIAALTLLFSGFSETAEAQDMLDPVSFSLTDVPQEITVGESFDVRVEATIEGEWHLYSINNDPDAGPYPTKFSTPGEALIIDGKIEESDPVIGYDPNFDAELGWHAKEASFTVPLKVTGASSVPDSISLEIYYQVCTDQYCLPPKTKKVSSQLATAQSAQNSDNAVTESSAPENDQVSTNIDEGEEVTSTTAGVGGEGIFSFLWIALAAGFAALLTPCVFPMIPLTVSFFSKDKEMSRGKGLGRALLFGAAIIATFTILGAILAMVIGASGANQFAANPWVNLFIGLVLLVFAFSLLGAFELRLPHQVTNWLNRKSNESRGIIGILFMSLTISAVSFSCTAPFVGGVLAATSGGQWFYPILGMMGFSAAFASPFVLFAIFPKWLESLPQSGSWMNIVKVLLGFIELAAAVKFISNADLVWNWGIVSRPFAVATWIAIFLLAGLYLLGTYSMKHETKTKSIGTGRLMLAVPFLLFSFYLIPGLLGSSLGIWDAWLPPKQATDVSVVYSIAAAGGGMENNQPGEFGAWSEDYQASVAAAKENNQPVFIDFTGYTCTNCRAMEANVFPVSGVQQRFDQMELVRLYTDNGTNGPELQEFQFELTGTIALPTYVVVNPHTGEVLIQHSGMADTDEFQKFLDAGLQQFSQLNQEYLGQAK